MKSHFFTLCKYLTLEVVHLIATLTMYSELTQNMYDLRIEETDQLTIKRNENVLLTLLLNVNFSLIAS